jgi:hypothetical protein
MDWHFGWNFVLGDSKGSGQVQANTLQTPPTFA